MPHDDVLHFFEVNPRAAPQRVVAEHWHSARET